MHGQRPHWALSGLVVLNSSASPEKALHQEGSDGCAAQVELMV